MNKSVKEKIWKIILSHGTGWGFCAKDFLADFKRNDIDTALFTLEQSGKIRKVCRGIYDYPMYSELLQKHVAPDLDRVAETIARSLRHEIQPTGNAALNFLSVSTQVQSQCIYLWDGRSQDFEVGNQTIHFKSAPRKDFSPKLLQSRLVVQALRLIGSSGLSEETKRTIQKNYPSELWKQIRTDTMQVPNWIHEQICELAK